MFRAVQVFVALVAAHTLSGSALFAQNCSCAAPSCVAPSCAVPMDCCMMPSCAAPGSCGGSCGMHQSAPACGGCQNCCPPAKKSHWIHIDLSRHITRRDTIKKNAGGFMGEAPPVGASVAMSSPIMFSTAAAIPVNFQSASTDNSAALVTALAAMVKANAAAAAPATAAATANTTCNDPCGDIKQLQSDVAQLKEIVVNLTNVVKDIHDKKIP